MEKYLNTVLEVFVTTLITVLQVRLCCNSNKELTCSLCQLARRCKLLQLIAMPEAVKYACFPVSILDRRLLLGRSSIVAIIVATIAAADIPFAARCYAKRVFLAVGRCPSLCMSHSCIVSTRLKITSNFSRLDSPIIPVFKPSGVTKFRGKPGALNARGRNNSLLSANISLLSWKRYKIGPELLWNINKISCIPIDPCQFR